MTRQLLALFFLGTFSVNVVWADTMPQLNNAEYKKECGACHMAYQPGFLPQRSWQKIMNSLDKHFGENAELGAAETTRISEFLTNNAAEKSNARLSSKMLKGLADDRTPLRISELSYFTREHHELSRKQVQDNPGVKSFSRCDSCHTKAANGSYSEREINIPGHGKWDD